MGKKWNTEMFIQYIKTNHKEFEVRGEYKNNNTKILMYHKKCKREFFITPANFKTRGTCSLCKGKFKKTTTQFRKEIQERTNDEYVLLSEYITAKTKVLMRHNVCGREWQLTPDDFLSGGTRCPSCFGNERKTSDQFRNEIYSKFATEYILLEEYINNKTPILMMHNSKHCNHKFLVSPDAFLRGSHCNKCGTAKRSGINHYRYNILLTPEERSKRDMFNGELKKWRQKIFERDHHTCAICKEKGGNLNAHHLYSWNSFTKLRFDLKNGITLCKKCHLNFHHLYGYGNNTEKQFKEWKASLV